MPLGHELVLTRPLEPFARLQREIFLRDATLERRARLFELVNRQPLIGGVGLGDVAGTEDDRGRSRARKDRGVGAVGDADQLAPWQAEQARLAMLAGDYGGRSVTNTGTSSSHGLQTQEGGGGGMLSGLFGAGLSSLGGGLGGGFANQFFKKWF